MNKQQMQDREQFRRYAEAALSGCVNNPDLSYEAATRIAFEQATFMMLGESAYWEAFQIQALGAIVDDERIRHEGK
jgi:hypothetical protein